MCGKDRGVDIYVWQGQGVDIYVWQGQGVDIYVARVGGGSPVR